MRGSCQGAPGSFGEGGAANSIGNSRTVVMMHYGNIYTSQQGGHNMTHTALPPTAKAHMSQLVWKKSSADRSKPDGRIFTVMTMDETSSKQVKDGDDDDDKFYLKYMHFGEQRDDCWDCPWMTSASVNKKWVLKTINFGENWTWTVLPDEMQAVETLQTDPSDSSVLYAVSSNCIAVSADDGESWQKQSDGTYCVAAAGVDKSKDQLSGLLVKDSMNMLLMRTENVPLKSTSGLQGPWTPLPEPYGFAPGSGSDSWSMPPGKFNISILRNPDCTQALDLSWSGSTLVMHGRDMSAPSRSEKSPYVAKTTDFGETWEDETGDIVTAAVNSGTWFGRDFYLTTSGEGLLLKRNFEAEATSSPEPKRAEEVLLYL